MHIGQVALKVYVPCKNFNEPSLCFMSTNWIWYMLLGKLNPGHIVLPIEQVA